MNVNNPIQNELKELNSILAGISNLNVYTVPDGYFEAVLHDILYATDPKAAIRNTGTQVPAGYFDSLADSIMNKIRSATDVSEDIAFNESSSLISTAQGINVYTVPPGYFEQLPGSILNKLNTGVTDEESSLLSSIKGIHVYTVPTGYFEMLSHEIVSRLQQPAKIVVMKRSFSIYRYAVAAVISGIIGLSVISVLNNKQTNAASSSNIVMETADKIIKSNSFDTELSSISDHDIVNYLQNNGEDVNAALVASVAEDKNLPDEVDYLTDDKTLDNLLNGLTIDQSKTN